MLVISFKFSTVKGGFWCSVYEICRFLRIQTSYGHSHVNGVWRGRGGEDGMYRLWRRKRSLKKKLLFIIMDMTFQ